MILLDWRERNQAATCNYTTAAGMWAQAQRRDQFGFMGSYTGPSCVTFVDRGYAGGTALP